MKSKSLDRGRLEFSTDDAGTLYLEWDKLVSVVANRRVEVVTHEGLRYLGLLGVTGIRSLAVVSPDDTATLAMADVTIIRPIGTNFWHKLDGSIDAGFSYTQSSGVGAAEPQLRHGVPEIRVADSCRRIADDDRAGRR